MKYSLRTFAFVALFVSLSAFSHATSYVGSWTVYNPEAPVWSGYAPDGPLAYTGQEVAAMLWGGSPLDYVISTVSSEVADINNQAWYDVIGSGAHVFAQDYNHKYLGKYYGPTSGYTYDGTGAASAWIRDNSVNKTNYAFRVTATVPESSSTLALIGLGLAGLVAFRRRQA